MSEGQVWRVGRMKNTGTFKTLSLFFEKKKETAL